MKITTYMILHSNHTFYWQQCRYVMVLSFEILWYPLCALRKLLKNFTGFWDNTLTLSETCDTCKHQKTWPSFFHIMMCCPSSTKLISKLMLVHCQSGYLAHIWMNLESTLNNFNDSLKIAFAERLPFGLGPGGSTSEQYLGIHIINFIQTICFVSLIPHQLWNLLWNRFWWQPADHRSINLNTTLHLWQLLYPSCETSDNNGNKGVYQVFGCSILIHIFRTGI